MPYNWEKIRTLLTEGFSKEELRRLCYEDPDFRPLYHQLGTNSSKDAVIQQMVEYAEQKVKIKKLLAWAKKQNPIRYEQHQPYHSTISKLVDDEPPPANSIIHLRTSRLADEVQDFLAAMKFQIDEIVFKKEKGRVEFLASGVAAGEIINRWYICVERKITPGDVERLEFQITNTPGSKGWMVTSQPIDNETPELLKTHPNISAVTIANFYRKMLQYDGYLKNELIRFEKDTKPYWVDLNCKKVNGDKSFDLVTYVNDWLYKQEPNLLVLSGDFGTGKTWFCQYYAAKLTKQHLENPDQHRIPILISLKGYTKALEIEQLITAMLVNSYGIKLLNFEIFNHLNQQGRLLLIFDGFDEMEQRIDYDIATRNFAEIRRLVANTSKVILTSRPYFLDAVEQIRHKSNSKILTLTLEVFNDKQIQEVLRKRLPDTWEDSWQQVKGFKQLRELASRPVMTEIIAKTLHEIHDPGQIDGAALYRSYYINQWIKKALRQEPTEPTQGFSEDTILSFVRDLAWEMFRSPMQGISPSDLTQQAKEKLGANVSTLHPEHLFVLDKTTNNYTFPHISFIEYFVADKVAAGLAQGDGQSLFSCTITDGVQRFLVDLVHSNPETQKGILDALRIAQSSEQIDTLTQLLMSLGDRNPVVAIINMLKANDTTISLSEPVLKALGKEKYLFRNDAVIQVHGVASSVRHFWLELLGSPAIRTEQALPELTTTVYQDSDSQMRLYAVKILGKRQGKEETRTLIETMERQGMPTEIRQACIDNIQIGLLDRSIRQQILAILHRVIDSGDDLEFRQYCVTKLAEYNSRKDLEPLINILSDFNHKLWLVSANTIEQANIEQADLPELIQDLENIISRYEKGTDTGTTLVSETGRLKRIVRAIKDKQKK